MWIVPREQKGSSYESSAIRNNNRAGPARPLQRSRLKASIAESMVAAPGLWGFVHWFLRRRPWRPTARSGSNNQQIAGTDKKN
jgi:hypothetical protein